MRRFLAVKMNEDEHTNYGIAFLAIPLEPAYVSQLASDLASCKQAFEAGAYQVKFMAYDVYVVSYLSEDSPRQGVLDALGHIGFLVEDQDDQEGLVVHINERNAGLLQTYKYQAVLMDIDGDMSFRVSTKYGPWAVSNTVRLARLLELVEEFQG